MYGVVQDQVDNEMGESVDRVSAANIARVAKDGVGERRSEDLLGANAHLEDEVETKARHGLLVLPRGLFELGLGFRLDVKADQRP